MNVYKILYETNDGLLSNWNHVLADSVEDAIKTFTKWHRKNRKHDKLPIEIRSVKRICKLCVVAWGGGE